MKCAIVLLVGGVAFAAPGVAEEAYLAATCAGCHGTNGHAAPDAGLYSLAGAPWEETFNKLKAFQSGNKPATIMHQIARGYSDRQLRAIATFFARQGKEQ